MAAAIEERLRIVSGYGCQVTDVDQLSSLLTSQVEGKGRIPTLLNSGNGTHRLAAPSAPGNIVTAADVLQAHHSGTRLQVGSTAVVTPLARELAVKHGVRLEQSSVR